MPQRKLVCYTQSLISTTDIVKFRELWLFYLPPPHSDCSLLGTSGLDQPKTPLRAQKTANPAEGAAIDATHDTYRLAGPVDSLSQHTVLVDAAEALQWLQVLL